MKNSLKVLITFALILQGILSESVVTKEKLDDICSGVKPRDFDFNETMTMPEYIESIDLGEQSHSLLDTYLTTDKVPPIPDILREMFLVIVIGLFIIIAILTWIGFWICCCKNCCAFKKAKISPGKKCCTFIIAVALFVITIGASITAFATSTNFVGDLNSLTCSFAKFYYHTEFGEEVANDTEATERWIGFEGIINMAGNTSTQIDVICQDTETFQDLDTLNSKSYDYNQSLYDLDQYGEMTIKSPNEKVETEITPMYAFEFLYNKEELVENETYLSGIRYEADKYINKSVIYLNALKVGVEGLKDQSETIKSTMSEVQTQVTNLRESVNKIGAKVFNAVYDYKDQANTLGLKFFRILFGLFIAFAVILLVILFLYSCTKCGIIKCILFLVWNVLLVFMILAFTVAAIFEVFTEAAYQIAPATAHIFTYEFLTNNTKFQVSEESAELLDICLNEDGNIADKLNVDEDTTNAINGLYTLMENIKQIGTIETHSTAIFDAQQGMQQYADDYSLATTKKNAPTDYDRVNEQIELLNNHLGIALIHNDEFVVKDDDCKPGYEIIYSKEQYDTTDFHCMIVAHISKETIEEIYGGTSEASDIIPKFNALKDFYENEQAQVNEIQGDLTTMSNKYEDTAKTASDITIKANSLSKGFLEVFEPIMATGDFKDIFTCRFIKKDLMSFMDIIFHEFKDDCKSICIGTFTAALASYVGLYFLLVTIYRHGKHKKKDDEYEEM